MVHTLEEFAAAFQEIQRMGWVQTHRSGPTGVGKTLEDLLGIPENNHNLPDFGDYELKSCRINSPSMLTMFTCAPLPQGANTNLLQKFGYPSGACGNGERILHATLSARRFTPIGPAGHQLRLICRPEGIFIASEAGIENVHWPRERLKKAFERKYRGKLVYAKAMARGRNSAEEFRYTEAYEVSGFCYDALLSLLEKGKVYADLRIGQYHSGPNRGKTHDHGTAFRIREEDQHLLFRKVRQIA